jgi:hypothetical protein
MEMAITDFRRDAVLPRTLLAVPRRVPVSENANEIAKAFEPR